MSDGGRGTDLDVSRSRAQLNSTLATIPPLEAIVARTIHRLGVLTGQQPTALVNDLKEPAPMPALPALVNIGNPESLLRRRPDVRAAERGLAAATASVGIATADLFPRVTFNGNIGFQATSIAGLVKPGADAWSFGPSITWAALDYGHVRSRIQAAGARNEAALAIYERTVLTTLEEVENALVDFGREQARRDFLNESAKASQIAANLARQRYENGATDFLTVLDAERILYQAQDELAQSQTRTGTALIAVYKSLGGGWENDGQPVGANVSK
jgi:outer membrane protein, multidrug efflux system